MKNKKTTWFLLPAVLAIWGLLSWKLYAAMKDDAPSEMNAPSAAILATETEFIADTSKLFLDYPDPFLTATKSAVKTYTQTKNTQQKTTVLPPGTIPAPAWPELRYSGLVKSPKDGKMLGFLSINGTSHFVKNGDVIDDIIISVLNRDSVIVKRGKEMRTVRK